VRLMDAHLEIFAIGRAEGSMSAANPRGVLAIVPGSYQWLPKWFDILSPADRKFAPREVADLIALGLRPL